MSNKLIIKLKVTCSLCGKSFPSHKSLCGHMRCHPDRGYRGLQPPDDALKFVTSKSQPLMAADDNDIDRIDVLSGWSMIEKGAVFALMLMATGNDCYRYVDNDKIEDELDKLQKLSISNKKPKLVHGSSSDQEQDCSADSANSKFKPDPSGIESDTMGKKRKRQTAKVKDSDAADAAASSKSYECSICNKTFATHQALGGHKSSSHTKHQFDHQQGIIIHDALVSSQPPPPPTAADTSVSDGGHICKTCDKAFSSGQALGGHMRCHWQAPALLGTSTTTSEAKPVLVFDLNQPVADDHTEEQE